MSASRSTVLPAFRFSCLGPVGLTSAAGAEVPFRTRKQAALLLLLARQEGTPLPRNHLLDLLWSGSDEASARHSLSHSVSLTNKALACEAITVSGKDQLALAEGLVWLDVNTFEECVRGGMSREARGLWRGNLFEGLHVPRAPRFERSIRCCSRSWWTSSAPPAPGARCARPPRRCSPSTPWTKGRCSPASRRRACSASGPSRCAAAASSRPCCAPSSTPNRGTRCGRGPSAIGAARRRRRRR